MGQGLREAYLRIYRGSYDWREEFSALDRAAVFARELQVIDLVLAPFLCTRMPIYNPVCDYEHGCFSVLECPYTILYVIISMVVSLYSNAHMQSCM